ncbi:MAG: phage tail tape measure protein [Nitrospirae bacterium YQR-1]
MISAGASVEDAPAALEASAKAAVAGVTDTKTAITAGMAVINAYGMSLNDLGRVYDTFFQTVKIGVTTFPELSQSIGNVLPTARAVGVGFNEVSAALAQLTNGGIKTPEAVTALNSALRSLAMPTAKAKSKLRELGIQWNGLMGTLEQISKLHLSASTLSEIIPDTEGIKGVMSLTQNFNGLVDTLRQIEKAASSTESAYKKMENTLENQIKLFKNSLDAISGSLMASFAPVVIMVAGAVKTMLDSFNELPAAVKGITVVLGVAAISSTVFGSSISKLTIYMKGLSLSTISATTAIKSLNGAFAAAAVATTSWELGTAISKLKIEGTTVGDYWQSMFTEMSLHRKQESGSSLITERYYDRNMKDSLIG